MKTCPKCGAQINDDDNFCIFCGEKVDDVKTDFNQSSSLTCKYCHNPVKSDDIFCPTCGMEIKGSGEQYFNDGVRENNSGNDENKFNNNTSGSIWSTFPKFFKNLFNFSGKTTVAEYWFPRVFLYILVTILVYIIPDNIVTYNFVVSQEYYELISYLFSVNTSTGIVTVPVISTLLNFLLEIIFIPAKVRRIRDTGRSPWYFFVQFIPVIGDIWLFIILIQPSNRYLNKF